MKNLDKFKHRTFCDGRIVMINADCREVMAEIGDGEIDLILTDPPYGINYTEQQSKAQKTANRHRWKIYHETSWDKERPNKKIFDELFRISKNQIIWGGNYFADMITPSQCWLVWYKSIGFSMADAELAFTSFDKATRIYRADRIEIIHEKTARIHPTQKPIKLMSWCLLHNSQENDLIFDAFAGSFTTAISCIRTKRRFIGVELDPVYFEKAVERIETELRQPSLF